MLTSVKIDQQSIVHLAMAVEYVSEYGRHRDVLHFEKFNVWRDMDLLPAEMQQQLMGKPAGYSEKFNFSAGQLMDAERGSLLYTIRNQDFNRQARKNLQVEPRCGRYYPRGWFAGVPGIYSEDMAPARLVAVDDEIIQVDLNHPLAAYDISIEVEVCNVMAHFDERGGRCNDAIVDLLTGPGMQLRHKNQATDFFADQPFKRGDEAMDGLFYAMPREVNHLDDTALQQLRTLYAELVPENASLLDLMSSVNSHLADELSTHKVTGLGMNQQELEANARLDERIIHDLNDDPVLPFDDVSYDAVVCSLSIEYLTRPDEIFQEVARILKPGGRFICSFSNRWFPTKAIQLWTNLHEFERCGLVSEYFIRSRQFKNINSFSVRGLSRPLHDRHAIPLSDPVYAVWGTRT